MALTHSAVFFLEGSIRWRFPLAFQIVFCLFVMVAVLFLPDSPRWLMMRGRREEARDVIARLSDAPLDSSEVALEMRNIEETLHVQMAGGGFKFRELLDRGPSRNLQRTTIAVAAQFGQQIGGACADVTPDALDAYLSRRYQPGDVLPQHSPGELARL